MGAYHRLSPEKLAGRGMARTFQLGRVFGNLSVMENVLDRRRIRGYVPSSRPHH